jgi:hypothetical protein
MCLTRVLVPHRLPHRIGRGTAGFRGGLHVESGGEVSGERGPSPVDGLTLPELAIDQRIRPVAGPVGETGRTGRGQRAERTWFLIRASMATIPRNRSGLTASPNPRAK